MFMKDFLIMVINRQNKMNKGNERAVIFFIGLMLLIGIMAYFILAVLIIIIMSLGSCYSINF
jgi:hypothetical protein